jgi:hypothetical protein
MSDRADGLHGVAPLHTADALPAAAARVEGDDHAAAAVHGSMMSFLAVPSAQTAAEDDAPRRPPSPKPPALRDHITKLRKRRQVSTRKALAASPIRKFTRYGRFPCKLLLNIIIFTLLALILLLCELPGRAATQSQRQTLIRAFMPPGYTNPNVNYVREPTFHFAHITTFRAFIRASTERYYGLVSSAPAYYNFYYEGNASSQTLDHWWDATDDTGGAHTLVGGNATLTAADVRPPLMVTQMRRVSARLSSRVAANVARQTELTPAQPYGPFAPFRASYLNRSLTQTNFRHACKARPDFVAGSAKHFLPCRTASVSESVFDLADTATVTFQLRSVVRADALTGRSTVYEWTVQQRYNFIPNGLVTLTIVVRATKRRNATEFTVWQWAIIATIIFSTWDLVLRVRAHSKIRRIKFARAARKLALRAAKEERRRERHHHHGHRQSDGGADGSSCSSWESGGDGSSCTSSSSDDDETRGGGVRRQDEASRWRKLQRNSMGQSWTRLAIVMDLCAIVFCCATLAQLSVPVAWWAEYTTAILGGFTMLLCASLFASYLRFFPSLYIIMICSSQATWHILNFFVAVMPIFVAYALFGTVVFGPYAPQFSDFTKSCTCLFSAAFGDSLLQMFQVTSATNSLLLYGASRVFTFTFIAMFFYAVLNVATSIILDSYEFVTQQFALTEHDTVSSRMTRLVAVQQEAQSALQEMAVLIESLRDAAEGATDTGDERTDGSSSIESGFVPVITVNSDEFGDAAAESTTSQGNLSLAHRMARSLGGSRSQHGSTRSLPHVRSGSVAARASNASLDSETDDDYDDVDDDAKPWVDRNVIF